jgi:hypothetical protein
MNLRISNCLGAICALARICFYFTCISIYVTQASADIIYTYIGSPFTNFHGDYSCPPECAITGTFTLAGSSPPANLAGSSSQYAFDVDPISWSFSDGDVTANNLNGCYDFFSLSTDSTGNIIGWVIRMYTPSTGTICTSNVDPDVQLLTDSGLPDQEDITIAGPSAVNFAANIDDPGTWTITVVREPNVGLVFIILPVIYSLMQRKSSTKRTNSAGCSMSGR